jgi:protein-S-isoprenylcysteine O-methyltransferase Ste14
MALIHSLQENGNKLFKYRGQMPLILFLIGIPFIYFNDEINIYILSRENLYWVITVICILLSFYGQYVRAVAIGTSAKHTSGRNTKEQVADSLNTTGIYSRVRHPLYLGNYFMWLGIFCYTFNPYFIVISSLLFWIYYERIMFAEERFLEGKFGDSYLEWSKKVPAFIPSSKNKIKSEIPFSMKTILRREYSGVTAVFISFVFIDLLRDYSLRGSFKVNYWSLGVLAFGLLISLVLRTLKHHTQLLSETDRS